MRQNFFSFWTIYCPFNLPNNPKNQSFEKMKKTPEDIIVLHTCTINDNHMIYSFCDMKHYRHFGPFLSFWAIFCPFTKLTTQKLKTLKKWKNLVKKSSDIILDIILHKCTKNHDHMLYCSWDMVCDRRKFYFQFALLPP